MLADLGHPYDTHEGIDRRVGNITTSSPPIVVNGVDGVLRNSGFASYDTSKIGSGVSGSTRPHHVHHR